MQIQWWEGAASFPSALAKAQAGGYACLGGQFQFRLDDGSTCEMYWLNADSTERTGGETWADYSRRSCAEVLHRFQYLMLVRRAFRQFVPFVPIGIQRGLQRRRNARLRDLLPHSTSTRLCHPMHTHAAAAPSAPHRVA